MALTKGAAWANLITTLIGGFFLAALFLGWHFLTNALTYGVVFGTYETGVVVQENYAYFVEMNTEPTIAMGSPRYVYDLSLDVWNGMAVAVNVGCGIVDLFVPFSVAFWGALKPILLEFVELFFEQPALQCIQIQIFRLVGEILPDLFDLFHQLMWALVPLLDQAEQAAIFAGLYAEGTLGYIPAPDINRPDLGIAFRCPIEDQPLRMLASLVKGLIRLFGIWAGTLGPMILDFIVKIIPDIISVAPTFIKVFDLIFTLFGSSGALGEMFATIKTMLAAEIDLLKIQCLFSERLWGVFCQIASKIISVVKTLINGIRKLLCIISNAFKMIDVGGINNLFGSSDPFMDPGSPVYTAKAPLVSRGFVYFTALIDDILSSVKSFVVQAVNDAETKVESALESDIQSLITKASGLETLVEGITTELDNTIVNNIESVWDQIRNDMDISGSCDLSSWGALDPTVLFGPLLALEQFSCSDAKGVCGQGSGSGDLGDDISDLFDALTKLANNMATMINRVVDIATNVDTYITAAGVIEEELGDLEKVFKIGTPTINFLVNVATVTPMIVQETAEWAEDYISENLAFLPDFTQPGTGSSIPPPCPINCAEKNACTWPSCPPPVNAPLPTNFNTTQLTQTFGMSLDDAVAYERIVAQRSVGRYVESLHGIGQDTLPRGDAFVTVVSKVYPHLSADVLFSPALANDAPPDFVMPIVDYLIGVEDVDVKYYNWSMHPTRRGRAFEEPQTWKNIHRRMRTHLHVVQEWRAAVIARHPTSAIAKEAINDVYKTIGKPRSREYREFVETEPISLDVTRNMTVIASKLYNAAIDRSGILLNSLLGAVERTRKRQAEPELFGASESECRATVDDPYKCCTDLFDPYACCRGLEEYGCVPYLGNALMLGDTINDTYWREAIKNKDSSTVLGWLMTASRLVMNTPIRFGIDRADPWAQPLLEVMVGWLAFPDGVIPPYTVFGLIVNFANAVFIIGIFLVLMAFAFYFGGWIWAVIQDVLLLVVVTQLEEAFFVMDTLQLSRDVLLDITQTIGANTGAPSFVKGAADTIVNDWSS